MTQGMHTAYWEAPPRHWQMRLPKWMLRRVAGRMLARERHTPLRFERAMCVSGAVKRRLVAAGLPLQEARVVHGGTDVDRFREAVNGRFQKLPLKLLYAGQIVEHKGVHTAIEAMAKLAGSPKPLQVKLTIMGAGHPDYELSLRQMVASAGLDEFIHFCAPVTRSEMPAVLRQYDVLVFPSIYEEPLARMTQEAMAANVVVIGTTTGGTSEILIDGKNGLTFPAGDASTLARQIERLLLEPALAGQLGAAGRESILDYFNLERMVGEIEAYLLRVAGDLSLPSGMLLEQSPT
jgi:glycosyltransferase involved in cell wall biosynthesis